MTGSTAQAPWFLARCTQFAVPATAGAGVVRALKVRAHLLHPSTTTASESARVSMIVAYLGTAAAVLFLLWFARCRRNAELLSPGTVRGSAAWAVLAWLIPGVNFWAPRGLLLDVQRASGPAGDQGRGDVLVNVWWAAWFGHGALVLAVMNLGGDTSLPLLVAVQALSLLTAVLTVALTQRITARQAAGLDTGRAVPVPDDLPQTS
ncbi:DUF4328 domain-containing protein [Streptomyces sp. NPDC007205]|uniref:DUF4328 domain-containing protein n=1 Tax=Streptomyces sp. NPDC007205 TaxID=3154316 RepID=UPI0033FAA123